MIALRNLGELEYQEKNRMVYVDDLYRFSMGKYGRMKMSHMIADTSEELFEMAEKIGLDKKHIQFEGQWKEHFDVSIMFRNKAIDLGAKEVSWRETFRILSSRMSDDERQKEIFLKHRSMKS
jgi:hypothetical protein